MTESIAAIAIGRNEGARLVRCLASLQELSPVIYVDSGSTDGSVAHAQAVGAEVVELDMAAPFTAARARNAGLERLDEIAPDSAFVQVLDGDCELREGWIEAARAAIGSAPDIAIVCGRRRERFPEASLWNQLTDLEWAGPSGEVAACGGDALLRRQAISEVGGYPADMIAGEEPEMCHRLRQAGWRILRLDDEMTWHDAAMTRAGQWWQRSRRAGHTYAEGAARHGKGPERYKVTERNRAFFWGAGIPFVALAGAFATPWALVLLLAYPAQILRLAVRGMPIEQAVFLTLGKLPEAQGVLDYWWNRLRGKRRGLVEYK